MGYVLDCLPLRCWKIFVKTNHHFRLGFFAFGCAAMVGVFWNIGWEGPRHAKALGADVHRVYLVCGVWTLLIWLLYPIAWGLCEGGNYISPDSEAVFYSVLDFCSKVVFGIALVAGHWTIDPGRLGLRLRDYGEPLAATRDEKNGTYGRAGYDGRPVDAPPARDVVP
jgi:bacteriorhodopsin